MDKSLSLKLIFNFKDMNWNYIFLKIDHAFKNPERKKQNKNEIKRWDLFVL